MTSQVNVDVSRTKSPLKVLTVAEIGGHQLKHWTEPEVHLAAERPDYYAMHLDALNFSYAWEKLY
jgi:hypothetical protein